MLLPDTFIKKIIYSFSAYSINFAVLASENYCKVIIHYEF